MNAKIRRLVLDTSPRRMTIAIVMYGLALIVDGFWQWSDSWLPALYAVVIFPLTMGYVGKLSVWRQLPVSRAELSRVVWWRVIARPAVILILLMPLALVVIAVLQRSFPVVAIGRQHGSWADVFGSTHRSWVDIAAVVAGQAAMTILAGALTLTRVSVGQRLRVPTTTLDFAGKGLFLAWLVVAIAAAYGFQHMGSAVHWQMAAAGAVAIIVATLLYVRAPPVGESSNLLKAVAAHRRAKTADDRFNRTARRGWLATGPSWQAIPIIAPLLIAAIFVVPKIWPQQSFMIPAFAPMLSVACALIYQQSLSFRTLRALPVSGLGLTIRLNAISQGLMLGVMAVLGLACHLAGLDVHDLGAVVAICMAACALCMPTMMRFGLPVGMFILLASTSALGGYAGSRTVRPGPEFGIPDLVAIATFAAAAVVGWAWCYWEIARGRRAYRGRSLTQAQWSGA